MTNQDPKYQAERDESAQEYAVGDRDVSKMSEREAFGRISSREGYKAGFDAATDYWSKRNEGEINRLTYELDKSRSSHCKIIEELEEKSKRMVPLDVVEKLVEALKYYADERQNERQINVCEFNENLNRMYVCGDGSRAREALAAWDEYKASKMKGM